MRDQRQVDQTEKKDKALISALKKLCGGLLSTADYKRLYPKGSVIPRLYGTPKTHKDSIPTLNHVNDQNYLRASV